MSEQPIMWVGRQPGQKKKAPDPETDEQLAAELTALCEGSGLVVQQFLVAHGNYGSWLVKLIGPEGSQRLLWDGKQRQLKLETEVSANNWEEKVCEEPAATDRDALVTCAKKIFSASDA